MLLCASARDVVDFQAQWLCTGSFGGRRPSKRFYLLVGLHQRERYGLFVVDSVHLCSQSWSMPDKAVAWYALRVSSPVTCSICVAHATVTCNFCVQHACAPPVIIGSIGQTHGFGRLDETVQS